MIGVSIGSSNTSIAKTYVNNYNKCKYEVILSETSQRMLPSVIAYTNSHRLIGEEANLVLIRHITKSCRNIIRLVGMDSKSPFGLRETELFSVIGIDLNEENTYKVSLNGVDFALSNESIMAAFIDKIKQAYVIKNNLRGKTMVFSYPDYFNCNQFASFTKAVSSCNIKDAIFIPESIALSHYYGYNKWKDLFPSSENITKSQMTKDQFVIFVDVGEAKTSFILTQYTDKSYKVVHLKSMPFFGGRDLDEALFSHFAVLFENEFKVSLASSRKAKFKLLEAIKKARQILTVNKEALIAIDSIYEDYDFTHLLTRDQFEVIIEYNLQMFSEQFDLFYRESLLFIQDSDIYGIEMAGDLMRTPCLQAIIKEVTSKDISKCVLTDECLSVGCALYGEMKAHSKNLQKVFTHVESLTNYSICCKVNGVTKGVISKGLSLPREHLIALSPELLQGEVISLSFHYEGEEISGFTTSNGMICGYSIHPEKLFNANGKLKESNAGVDLVVGLNINGIIDGFYFKQKDQVLNYTFPTIQHVASGLQQLPSELVQDTVLLRDIEDRCMAIDEKYLQFSSDKNKLEGKCYQLKNKIREKHCEALEYKHKPVMKWIEKITEDIEGLLEPSGLLSEIDALMNDISSFCFSSNEAKGDKKRLLAKIDNYQKSISEELMKLLSNQKGKYSQGKIDQLAEKLQALRNQVLACNDEVMLEMIEIDLDKEFISGYH